MGDLNLQPHKPQPTAQPQPQPTQPEAETTVPSPKGIILLFGRGTVVYDPGRYILIPLTAFQPHPVHQPKEWVQFLETLLRAFLLSRAQKIVLAVEKAQVPTVLALIGRIRTDKKVLPARVEVKDGKLTYFPD
jgi:hypothetical protein